MSIDELDGAGRSPLHYAALNDNVREVIDLLERGSNPDAQDADGFTPLHFAAQQQAVAAARALLEAGAAVDIENTYGNTPLWVAVFNSGGGGELIELLRVRGADPNHVNAAGETPVGLARLIGNYDVARFFADVE